MDKTLLIVVLFFPVAFVALWAGVTRLLSVVSGWSWLAGSYRGLLTSIDRSERMASARIGRFVLVNYNHVLNVSVGAEGVQLDLFRLFAFGSPPLLIPWSAMGDCRSHRLMGMFDRFTFRPAPGNVKIVLAGRAARMLRDEAVRRGLPMQLPVSSLARA